MKNNYFKLFAGCAIVIYVTIYTLTGELLSSIGKSITLAIVVETLYTEWLWRYIPLGRPPVLHKKYAAYHRSSHNGGSSHTSTIYVKQTWLTVSICEEMSDGICFSETSSFKATQFGKFWRLVVTYIAQTDYRAPDENINDSHYGTIILDLNKSSTDCLSGRYFTGRHTPTSGSSVWIVLEDGDTVKCPKCQRRVNRTDLKFSRDGSICCNVCRANEPVLADNATAQ